MSNGKRGGNRLSGLAVAAVFLATTAGGVSALSRFFQLPMALVGEADDFQFAAAGDEPRLTTQNSAIWPQTLSRSGPAWLVHAMPGYSSGRARELWYLSLDRSGDRRLSLEASGTVNDTSSPYQVFNVSLFNNIAFVSGFAGSKTTGPSQIAADTTATVWAGTGASNSWTTAGNWTNGVPNNTLLAQFAATTNTANTVGISGTTASAAGIEVTSARASNITIGSSGTTLATLTLTLSGATINSVTDTILRNNSSFNLTFQPNTGQSNPNVLTLGLGDATNNNINIDGSGNISIGVIIKNGAGNKITLGGAGTGALILSGANTYTGGTTVNTGTTLALGADSNTFTSGSLSSGSLGTGTVTLAGGRIQSTTPNRVIANKVTITGDVTFGSTSASGVPLIFDAITGYTTPPTNPFTLGGPGNSQRTLTTNVTTRFIGAITETNAGTGLIKLGLGRLDFGNPGNPSADTSSNTYTGLTTISAGQAFLAKQIGSDAIHGNLLINGTGSVQLLNYEQIADTSIVTINDSGQLNLAGFTEIINALNGSGGKIVNDNTSFSVVASTLIIQGSTSSGAYSGLIADHSGGNGTIQVTIANSGGFSQTLSGANTYSGGTSTGPGAKLLVGSDSTVAGGVLTSGPVGVGTLSLDDNTHLQSSSTAARTLENNVNALGPLFLGDTTNNGLLTFSSTGLTTPSTFALNSISGSVVITTLSDVTISNAVGGVSQLDKSGSATLLLGGVNTYNGTQIDQGTLRLSGAGTLGSNTGVLRINGGTLDLNGTSQSVGTMSGNGGQVTNSSGTPSTLTVGNGNGTGSYAGAITNTGDIAITKTGSGTQTLTANNSYTGTTTVNGGTLELKNSGGVALSGTSGVAINNGGTLLFSANNQLNQAIAPPITLGTIGGTGTAPKIDAGNTSQGGPDAAGTAGLGALTLNVNSTISLTGNNSVLHFADSSGQSWQPSAILSITNWNGIPTTGGGTEQLLFGNGNVPGLSLGQLGQIQFIDPSGFAPGTYSAIFATLDPNEIVPGVAVPEPGTWIGAALALAAIGFTQRKRFKAKAKTLKR